MKANASFLIKLLACKKILSCGESCAGRSSGACFSNLALSSLVSFLVAGLTCLGGLVLTCVSVLSVALGNLCNGLSFAVLEEQGNKNGNQGENEKYCEEHIEY